MQIKIWASRVPYSFAPLQSYSEACGLLRFQWGAHS